jgi:hypothetical protein
MTNQEEIQKTLMDCKWFAGMVDKILNISIKIQTEQGVTGSRKRIRGRARLVTEIQDLLYAWLYSRCARVVMFHISYVYGFRK